jgi:hypothetical protein
MMNNHRLRQSAHQLKLSGLLQSLEIRLQEAISNQLTHAEFLELLFQDEMAVRATRAVERRKKNAGFRETTKH